MASDRFLSLYPKEFLKQYNGFIALDIDGVFADTWLGHIRWDHPRILDRRLIKFAFEYPEFFKDRSIGRRDVRGVQFESLAYLCALAADGKFGFIIVSSWVSTPNTCRGVDALMNYMGVKNELPLVVGQTGGGGGFYREQSFFDWIREFTDSDRPKELLAVDDSGYRHFPIFHQSKNLVAPIGRIGYNTDDYIRSIRKLRLKKEMWYSWASKGYIEGAELPELPRDTMWYLIHTHLINRVFNPWYEPGKGWRSWVPRFKRWYKWYRERLATRQK